MASGSSIVELATQISKASSTIAAYLSNNGIPQPSLSPTAPLTFPRTNDEIELARSAVREAARNLLVLVEGPSEHVMWELSCRCFDIACLQWIIHYNIPSHVPLESDISYSELAKSAGVDEQVLKRVIRFAITFGVFAEPSSGIVAHTALSAVFVKEPIMRSWTKLCTEDTAISAVRLLDALQPSPQRSAFQVAYGTENNYFQWIADKPDHVKAFAESMETLGRSAPYSADHLAYGYDWSGLGNAKVVDVGGGKGHVSIAIARNAPGLSFVVQDLPEVVAVGEQDLPAELKPRFEFRPLDFWASSPMDGADVYLLRLILHDYPDELAIKLLKNIVPSLKHGAKVILCEGIMPEPGAIPANEERVMRRMDLQMANLNNAVERSLENWKTVISSADPRLKVRKISTPLGSAQSIIEVVFDSENTL